jgi:anti-sigma B factor antagonist
VGRADRATSDGGTIVVEALMTDSSDSPMRVVVQADHDTVTVALGGEFDLNAASHFSSCTDEMVVDGTASVVIDLADLTFIDSAGVAALVDCHQRLNASGRRLRVINIECPASPGLDMAGLRETLTGGGP